MPPFDPPHLQARAAVRLLAVLATLAAAAALLACGSSNTATDAAATERAKEEQGEKKAADFARCLREHGVKASASSSGGTFQLRIQGSPGSGGPQAMVGAQKACAKYRPEPKKINLSPQEKVKREEEVLKFAKCMREHGIDVHTEVGGGKVAIGIGGSSTSAGPNPGSPAFQSAQKACSGFMHNGPKGGFLAPGAQVPDKGSGGETEGAPGASQSGEEG